MSLTITIDAMVAAGCTAEQLAAVVRAHEEGRQASNEARRAKDAERKRLSRMSRGQGVTARDTLSPKERSPTPPKEITPIPATLLGARDPLEGREADLLEALGVTDETKTPGLLTLSEPLNWITNGCDLDADILPALRFIAARGRAVKSWAYCSQAVFEARDRRLAPPPPMQQHSARGSPPNRPPRNAGESARLELIRRENEHHAAITTNRHDDESDRNTGFAGTGIARRIALAASG